MAERDLDVDLDFRGVVTAIGDGILVVDAGGIVRFANPAAATILGVRNGRISGLPFGSALVGGQPAELEVARPGRQTAVVHMTRAPIRWGCGPAEVVTLRDVTDRVLAERRLAQSEARYALGLRGANDGLWDWDLDTDECFTSPRCAQMLGYAPEELAGRPAQWWIDQVHPDDGAHLRDTLDRHLSGLTPRFVVEVRVRRQDGSWAWLLARGVAVREQGRARRFAGSITDMSGRHETEDGLRRLALYDPLTGLANRVLFLDRLRSARRRATRNGERFAVLFLDLDQFKAVNDTLGHAAGDALLVEVAARLSGCVRGTDTVARMGGDEFAVLIGGPLSAGGLWRSVRRIQRELGAPVPIGHNVVHTGASIGVALGEPGSSRDEEEVLHLADLAMYRAKEKGAGSVEVSATALDARVAELLAQQDRFLGAVDHGELSVRYQPIVDLASGRIVGFEALLRWRAGEDLLLPAAAFLDAAEVTGAIIDLGWDVLARSCRQVKAWRAAGHEVSVSVNLSARQVAVAGLSERVAATLTDAGLDGSALALEVPEQALQANPTGGLDQLARCRELGVGVVVDDFGCGQLPLAGLSRLPMSAVKIDRSFVARIGGGLDLGASGGCAGDAVATVRAILVLARVVGVEVIAEGVETETQRDLLLRLGCTRGQGFLFAPALDAGEAGVLLGRGPLTPRSQPAGPASPGGTEP